MRLLTMAPKTRVKRKVQAAGQASANTRKKQRVSLDSVETLPTNSEIVPSLIGSRLPIVEGETPATDVGSIAGPSSGLEGASIAGPSYSGEGSTVSGRALARCGSASPSSNSNYDACKYSSPSFATVWRGAVRIILRSASQR